MESRERWIPLTMRRARTLWIATSVAVAVATTGSALAQASRELVGSWKDPPDHGTQETLTLYENGAYKSETVIVDRAAFRDHTRGTIVQSCSHPRARKKDCDEKGIERQIQTIAKMYPWTMIGTYATHAARIEFTHGCSEGAEHCTPGLSTDEGVFFLEGRSLTIKVDGHAYKGKVIGGYTAIYTRQP